MDLLNLSFAIFVIKVAICVLPTVLAVFLIACSEERKRELRSAVCSKVFGMSNAISYTKFARTMVVLGVLLLLFSLTAFWFLLLQDMLTS